MGCLEVWEIQSPFKHTVALSEGSLHSKIELNLFSHFDTMCKCGGQTGMQYHTQYTCVM